MSHHAVHAEKAQQRPVGVEPYGERDAPLEIETQAERLALEARVMADHSEPEERRAVAVADRKGSAELAAGERGDVHDAGCEQRCRVSRERAAARTGFVGEDQCLADADHVRQRERLVRDGRLPERPSGFRFDGFDGHETSLGLAVSMSPNIEAGSVLTHAGAGRDAERREDYFVQQVVEGALRRALQDRPEQHRFRMLVVEDSARLEHLRCDEELGNEPAPVEGIAGLLVKLVVELAVAAGVREQVPNGNLGALGGLGQLRQVARDRGFEIEDLSIRHLQHHDRQQDLDRASEFEAAVPGDSFGSAARSDARVVTLTRHAECDADGRNAGFGDDPLHTRNQSVVR